MRRPVAVRMVGPMQWIVYPALVAAVGTLILATPVELFGLKLPEPILPLVLAFAWPLIRPSVGAPFVLFLLGLFLDLILGPALGLWPLCLLAVYGVVLVARNLLAGQETVFLFGWYGAGVALAFFLAYLLVGIRAGTPPSLLALVGQVIPTLLLFPLAHWLIERFDDGDVRFR